VHFSKPQRCVKCSRFQSAFTGGTPQHFADCASSLCSTPSTYPRKLLTQYHVDELQRWCGRGSETLEPRAETPGRWPFGHFRLVGRATKPAPAEEQPAELVQHERRHGHDGPERVARYGKAGRRWWWRRTVVHRRRQRIIGTSAKWIIKWRWRSIGGQAAGDVGTGPRATGRSLPGLLVSWVSAPPCLPAPPPHYIQHTTTRRK